MKSLSSGTAAPSGGGQRVDRVSTLNVPGRAQPFPAGPFQPSRELGGIAYRVGVRRRRHGARRQAPAAGDSVTPNSIRAAWEPSGAALPATGWSRFRCTRSEVHSSCISSLCTAMERWLHSASTTGNCRPATGGTDAAIQIARTGGFAGGMATGFIGVVLVTAGRPQRTPQASPLIPAPVSAPATSRPQTSRRPGGKKQVPHRRQHRSRRRFRSGHLASSCTPLQGRLVTRDQRHNFLGPPPGEGVSWRHSVTASDLKALDITLPMPRWTQVPDPTCPTCSWHRRIGWATASHVECSCGGRLDRKTC